MKEVANYFIIGGGDCRMGLKRLWPALISAVYVMYV